jgi:phosphoserine aminotransferase
VCTDPDDTDAFLRAATEAGCDGVKGHRSVGGFRASIYNSMPRSGVERLVRVMQDFKSASSSKL